MPDARQLSTQRVSRRFERAAFDFHKEFDASMTEGTSNIRFKAKLLRPAKPLTARSWTFLILPKEASAKLSTRGMTRVGGTINGHPFRATLEPDGQKSHWVKVTRKMREAAGAEVGDVVPLEIVSVRK